MRVIKGGRSTSSSEARQVAERFGRSELLLLAELVTRVRLGQATSDLAADPAFTLLARKIERMRWELANKG